MDVRIEQGWKSILHHEFEKEYFIKLTQFVKEEYKGNLVFPPAPKIFNAFDLCPFEKTRVVILGQDPYHDINQAHGLCFSVLDGVRLPPSLLNIYKELESDLGIKPKTNGNLERWATQGVFLLNATLTVRAHQPGSHQGKGWEVFTDNVIHLLSQNKDSLVFMLWGSYAIKKSTLIDSSKHLVLTSAHPSPLSAHRGFWGNKHFSKANEFLISKKLSQIFW